jgi:hypothetical protein
VIFNSTMATAFSNVPLSIMQGFSNTNNPVTYYSSFVLPYYHALLLAQTNNCPLLFENGAYIWTTPATPPSGTDFLLLANNVNFLLLSNGVGKLCLARGC